MRRSKSLQLDDKVPRMGGRPQRCPITSYKCHFVMLRSALAVQSCIAFHVPNQSESYQLELRPSTSMTTMMMMRQGFPGFVGQFASAYLHGEVLGAMNLDRRDD